MTRRFFASIATRVALLALVATVQPGLLRADLHCPSAVHHAGEVRSGVVLRHRFELSNRGSTLIDITGIKPNCGCLRPQVDKVTLQPGESANVTVEVNTVTQTSGTSWGAVVSYRDGGQEAKLPLVIQADLIQEINISPANVVLQVTGPMKHTFTLTDTRETPLQVKVADAGQSFFRASVTQMTRRGNTWAQAIDLDVLASCPAGRHDGHVVLYTSDAKYPEIRVPFTVSKKLNGVVQVSPSTLEYQAEQLEAFPSKILMLSAGDEEAVLIESVKTSHPSLRCTWAHGPGKRATMRVVVDADKLPTGKFDGSVSVQLQRSGQVVTVPVKIDR